MIIFYHERELFCRTKRCNVVEEVALYRWKIILAVFLVFAGYASGEEPVQSAGLLNRFSGSVPKP